MSNMNYKQPLLSVITVSLWNDDSLLRTVSSLEPMFNLLGKNLEHIIVSPDTSCNIFKESLFSYKEKTGIYPAMNHGLNKAKGDYVWFLNGGDECINSSTIVDFLCKNASNNQPHIITFPVLRLYPEGLTKIYSGGFTKPHQGIIYKKSIFDLLGKYEENYKLISDRLHFDLVRKSKTHIIDGETPSAIFYMDGASSSCSGWKITRNEYLLYYLRNPIRFLYLYRSIKLTFRLLLRCSNKSLVV